MRWRRTVSRGVTTAASVVTATTIAVISPTVALAQGGAGANAPLTGQVSQGQQRPQGPMTVERVENGFVIAPDFRISTFDDRTARFAGLYGGWLIDNALLIGGAGYWLTNGSSGEDMAYGGVVVQWADHANRTAGF